MDLRQKGIGMSYKNIRNHISRLVDIELLLANAANPAFASDHKGYAVLKEEIEEAGTEYKQITDFDLTGLWRAVKSDAQEAAAFKAVNIRKNAIRLACEAVQVAAMAKKFEQSQITRNERSKKKNG